MEGLYFKIYRKGIFSELGKLLGMQDISVGYREFEEDFIIKDNNESLITQLFSNEKTRELLERFFYFVEIYYNIGYILQEISQIM